MQSVLLQWVNLFQICFFEIIDFSIILGFASAEDAKNTT